VVTFNDFVFIKFGLNLALSFDLFKERVLSSFSSSNLKIIGGYDNSAG
jgi:hypothetical protein